MEHFTGWEYLMIDVANQYGLDKLPFKARMEWVTERLESLENLADKAEVKPLYLKAVMALRKAQKGIPSGHLVGFDACCSGIQIMSAVTGCVAGATATGLVDPDTRADAYSTLTEVMNEILHGQGIQVDVPRKKAKESLMTSFYGSKAKPIEIFGEDTPELSAFYQAAFKVAPGAWELLQDLLSSWQPYALSHEWVLPDGYEAKVKVMDKVEARIEVDELDHATFSYEFYENIGAEKGLSNAANVIHSLDAFVLREIHRRCNYDAQRLQEAMRYLAIEVSIRNCLGHDHHAHQGKPVDVVLDKYQYLFEKSGIVSAVVFNHIHENRTLASLSTEHVQKLYELGNSMMTYQPFPVVTIHDEFKCHPNHINTLRYWYKELLADLADSTVISWILSQIHGVEGHMPKLSNNLGHLIRQSNYALS